MENCAVCKRDVLVPFSKIKHLRKLCSSQIMSIVKWWLICWVSLLELFKSTVLYCSLCYPARIVVVKEMETALDGNQDKDSIFHKENPLFGADMNFCSSGRYDFQTSGKDHTHMKIRTVQKFWVNASLSSSPELSGITAAMLLMQCKCNCQN